MDSTFKLRREDHVHEEDREDECPDELGKSSFKFPCPTRNTRGVSRWQIHFARRFAQCIDSVSQCKARSYRSANRDLAFAIESINSRGTCVASDLDQVVEPDKPTARGRYVQTTDCADVVAIMFSQSELHVVIFIRLIISIPGSLFLPANHQTQTCSNV